MRVNSLRMLRTPCEYYERRANVTNAFGMLTNDTNVPSVLPFSYECYEYSIPPPARPPTLAAATARPPTPATPPQEPKEERLADPGSRGEDSDGVEGEDESESEKRRGVPSLRERLPMSAGLGVGELRARLGVWFGSVVALDGAGVVSISVGRYGYSGFCFVDCLVEFGDYSLSETFPIGATGPGQGMRNDAVDGSVEEWFTHLTNVPSVLPFSYECYEYSIPPPARPTTLAAAIARPPTPATPPQEPVVLADK
ncbi:hypothetical protein LOTGIDRAFT_155661 [Lottia gigantea]|uniref:Uncharacterized protein n=1 Tax=Lottia gigantea TaxID=225164 RepID=V3YX55_LOTGI|nr:hypothetical protein LOTGIDRAFT_155661 [Lottia gigantea]ESO82648.1 hypothetical protein LOTGIDRAFT_155661 [Lottia gigantea]